ncbi:DUF86 domain-containing protein [Burkholderia ubonensis]|uniref:HepT-like ribonuclease domain-containing protein n=1 Tax=Burkholderia ubonensis TaxID=101571 RepID=UPI0007C78648|nr:HepT-like ribonuclease domain-containing protein [Burkholderia ubonensis]
MRIRIVIDAVIRNIEVIGEASNKVRKHHRAFADAHPEVPWQGCYEMRSVVAHDYFKVDLDIVWETIKNDLPGMRRDVQAPLTVTSYLLSHAECERLAAAAHHDVFSRRTNMESSIPPMQTGSENSPPGHWRAKCLSTWRPDER